MKEDEEKGEDIAGLFKKFGGDAKGYREFDHAPAEPGGQESSWRLLPGGRPANAPVAPVLAPVAQPTPLPPPPAPPPLVSPRVQAPAPVQLPAPAFAPAPATVHAPAPTAAPTAARPLDVLFARLAADTAAPAEAGHTLLSRWRRPS